MKLIYSLLTAALILAIFPLALSDKIDFSDTAKIIIDLKTGDVYLR